MIENMRRLHPRGAANRGVCVDAEGAVLGPDCILVHRTPHGFRTLERGHAAAVQKCTFDITRDDDWLFRQTQRIAAALDRGEIALAQIHGLYIPATDLDDRRLKRAAAVSALYKADYDPDEPRIPKGDPHGGEWTTGDATSPASLDALASGDSAVATTNDSVTPGVYAVTTDDGDSPALAENGNDSSPSSAKPSMTFEQAPSVPAPPAPAPTPPTEPAPLPGGDDDDAGPSTFGSDDVGDSPPTGSATTEQPDQSDDTAPDVSLPELGQAPLPDIPEDQPDTTKQINTVLRTVATWLGRALTVLGPLFELDPRVRLVVTAIETVVWIVDYLPKIHSYLDAPKTLAELQSAATRPAPPGYEVHHIVEAQKGSDHPQSNARNFPDLIDSSENLVRVPYWKHVEISSWYSTINEIYNDLSPRDYFRGKSWEEQYEIGLKALRRFGVLK